VRTGISPFPIIAPEHTFGLILSRPRARISAALQEPSSEIDMIPIRIRRLALLPMLALVPSTALALKAQAVAAAPAATQVLDPSLVAIDSLFAVTYPAGGPGAAVLVARDGRVLMRKAYGMADVELGVPLRPEHVFRLGSITKQFTAVGVLMLVDEGKLSLDDEITKFFPDYPTQGRRITVEHLLTHTSGIRSFTGVPAWAPLKRTDLTPAQLIAVFRDQPMDFAPGTDWRYNNSGYFLLGAIIEKVSGQSYADFVRTRIFEPLGMRDTRVESQTALIPRRVHGYAMGEGRAVQNADFISLTSPFSAGAVVSTVDDLFRWGQAVAAGRLLKPETWRRAFTAYRLADGRSSGYGYGWFVTELAGRPEVTHGGDIDGFSSDELWIPSAHLQMYVLSNVERSFANPGSLTTRIAERVLGVSAVPPAVALPAATLDEYVGVYRVSEHDARVFTREGVTLLLQRNRGPLQMLRAVGGDEFVSVATGARFTFVREGGRVTGLKASPRLGPEEAVSPRTAETPESAAAAPAARATVAPEVLDAYVGEYELAPNFILTVRREGTTLLARATGQQEVTLLPQTETRFAIQQVEATIDFERDAAGKVVRLQLTQGGRTLPAPKIR
jgi:D-alanyl-D-alanine carboxypeptidase